MDVRDRYQLEISSIMSRLDDLKRGIFYERDNTKGTASAITIANNIEVEFIKLLDKIENNKVSTLDVFDKYYNEIGTKK